MHHGNGVAQKQHNDQRIADRLLRPFLLMCGCLWLLRVQTCFPQQSNHHHCKQGKEHPVGDQVVLVQQLFA